MFDVNVTAFQNGHQLDTAIYSDQTPEGYDENSSLALPAPSPWVTCLRMRRIPLLSRCPAPLTCPARRSRTNSPCSDPTHQDPGFRRSRRGRGLLIPARRIALGMTNAITKPFIAIGRFTRQTVSEIRKVVTPTVREWAGWIAAVFVFVLLLMVLVTGMDFGLGKLTLYIFG